jgi:hypothetical protein
MSAEPQPKTPPGPDPFGRQFDELDELMQRMLAISVEKSSAAAPPLPAFIPVTAPPALQRNIDFEFANPPVLSYQHLTKTAAEPDEQIEVLAVWWLKPLAVVNRAFDGLTSLFGPPGRLLRNRFVRACMGICGLAMLIGSMVWLLWEGTDWNW